ncbi:MAG: hypothetical protein HYY22_03135 [Thaumarchaeota archaeon]|nr:hypothetical protein [Nitrososphaerota archaeon]
MPVTVTNRKVDKKRRVTLPPNINLKEGSKIFIVSSLDTAIITSNKHIAERLAKTLRKLETNLKTQTLTEWGRMIDEAGLTSLTSQSIDHTIAHNIQRPKNLLPKQN